MRALTATATPPSRSEGDTGRGPGRGLGTVVALLLGYLVLIGAVHIAQGTADLGVVDVWRWALGLSDSQTAAVVTASRLPRMLAGVVAGCALGAAGIVTQSFSRNVLASPDTLAVNDAAFLAVVLSAVFGFHPALLGQFGIAFVGGLAGAVLVLALAGGGYGTVRLILAGIALSLVLYSITTALLILFPMEARGQYAWSAGTLSQTNFDGVIQTAPVVAVAVTGLLLLGRRLDILLLGDDAAGSLGIRVRRTQAATLALAVLLAAAAVTLVGPIGFVGLVAPTLVRLLAPRVPGLHRHVALIPVAALTGVALTLTADVAVRALVGAQRAVQVPTGVVTSFLGAIVLVTLALRLRASTFNSRDNSLDVHGVGRGRFAVVACGAAAATIVAVVLALLAGDRMLLGGDLVNWVRQDAGPIVSAVLSSRAPRVAAALLAGVALAVAGTAVQGVTRNPLADTSIIGVAGGASLFAVIVVTFLPQAGFWVLVAAAGAGAAVAAGIVFGLTARTGFATDRLILVGVGVSVGATALVTLVIVTTDPFNQSKALTWLSGSTYGRSFPHLIPLALGCLLMVPLIMALHRRLDLLSIDDEFPVVVGIAVARTRLLLLGAATVLTGVAVAAIGVVSFVGLVAPHAARTLVGRRHRRVLPVAALLGGCLVVCADLLGRAALAPIQLPASLLTAVIGAPYFLWLMFEARSRAKS